MTCGTSISNRFAVLTFLLLAAQVAVGQNHPNPALQPQHPAVGSWFCKAVQLCPSGGCPGGAITLYMTPTLFADGSFNGNDSLTLAGPPFGPHTVAYGKWVRTSPTGIIADYVFMLPGPVPSTIIAPRFRWQAQVTDSNTMVGWVNIYFSFPIPLDWESLPAGQFPTIHPNAQIALTPPTTFYTDPNTCTSPGCPVVVKFTIRRVTP